MYFFTCMILALSLNYSIKDQNSSIIYHNKMADTYFHKGNYPEMLYHLQEKVKYDKQDTQTWADISYYYWSMSVNEKNKKEYYSKKALSVLLDGLNYNKDSYYLYDEIGKYYLNSAKDFKLALPYFEQSITKKDCTNIPFHILARCYESDNQPLKAVSTIESCLKKFPNDAKAKAELNKLYNKIKD
jgi:tetratricopeptide (TPR) repeat protein